MLDGVKVILVLLMLDVSHWCDRYEIVGSDKTNNPGGKFVTSLKSTFS